MSNLWHSSEIWWKCLWPFSIQRKLKEITIFCNFPHLSIFIIRKKIMDRLKKRVKRFFSSKKFVWLFFFLQLELQSDPMTAVRSKWLRFNIPASATRHQPDITTRTSGARGHLSPLFNTYRKKDDRRPTVKVSDDIRLLEKKIFCLGVCLNCGIHSLTEQ